MYSEQCNTLVAVATWPGLKFHLFLMKSNDYWVLTIYTQKGENNGLKHRNKLFLEELEESHS